MQYIKNGPEKLALKRFSGGDFLRILRV